MGQQTQAPPTKVCIFSPEESVCEALAQQSTEAGYNVEGKFNKPQPLLDFLLNSDLQQIVVVDLDDNREARLQLIKELSAKRPLPIVAVSNEQDRRLTARAIESGAQTFILKPVQTKDIYAAFLVAAAQQTKQEKLEIEIQTLSTKLTDRKIIERAKGILIDSAKLSEAEAFRLMQKQSQSESRPMVEIARSIISTNQLVRQAARPKE